jgi:phosphate starvation-inducible PhoH-like protein
MSKKTKKKNQATRHRNEKFSVENHESYQSLPPKTSGQQELQDSIFQNDLTIASGSAGSGKTLMSIQCLFKLYKDNLIDSIKIIRLASSSFGEKLGAPPGEIQDKLAPLSAPILDNLRLIIPEGEIKELLRNNKIEIIPLSHIRGRSFINKGILLDEAQNLDKEMMLSCLTRIGEGTKFVVVGDPYQIDFKGRNGIKYAMDLCAGVPGRCEGIPNTGVITLQTTDIQRHPIVTGLLENAEKLED